MNSINRLEETWTPQWDLGLQEEFGFSTVEEKAAEPALSVERPTAWAMATREVMNRQSPVQIGVASCTSTRVDELVRFLDALCVEVANDE